MNHQILIAGFGGQGILFSGKFLAYAGLIQNYEVSWLPSYGPEMRGGTANCNVMIGSEPIGSPIVLNPTALVVMNAPSLEKFEMAVVPGGKILVDSSLISKKVKRNDTENFYIPALSIATEHKMPKLANMIITGKLLKETGIINDEQTLRGALEKTIPPSKAKLFDTNLKALKLGMSYSE